MDPLFPLRVDADFQPSPAQRALRDELALRSTLCRAMWLPHWPKPPPPPKSLVGRIVVGIADTLKGPPLSDDTYERMIRRLNESERAACKQLAAALALALDPSQTPQHWGYFLQELPDLFERFHASNIPDDFVIVRLPYSGVLSVLGLPVPSVSVKAYQAELAREFMRGNDPPKA